MPSIEVDGATLAYDEAGTGDVVVFLHAGIADRRMWRGQVALAGRFRLIALDLRGYGESDLPSTPFAHHDDVVGLLDALGIDRATLVGCSFGGSVAIDTALAHPDRVAALALFGTAVSGHDWTAETSDLWDALVGDVPDDDFDAMAEAEVRFWVVGPGRLPEEVDPELIAFARDMDRRALAAEAALGDVITRELDPPAIGRLGELRMPVLVQVGTADVPDIGRLADRIAADVPGAIRLPDLPNAGHLLPLEHPDLVNAALLDFLG
nr:alpha/beta hydrolase [Micromonospora sp. DSM 115978]